jgi:guanidinopropionase
MDAEAAKNLIETTTSCDFASYIKTYSGIATFFRTKYTADFPEADIALIGLPIDAGLTQRTGARHGPREVRTQSCNVLYFNPLTGVSPLGLCRVRDIGDVPVPSAFNLEQMIDEIFAFYRKLHATDVVPLTVGGDHSITFPIIKVLGASEPLGLVHIDAHLDTAESMSGSTLHHGSPFSNGVKAGVLDAKRTVHIGIRDPYIEFEKPFADETGMTIIDINRFHDLGIARVIAVIREVVGSGPAYITFDIDGLDPAFAPGTGTPAVGGLTSYEAKRLLQGLRGLDIVGGDVVEVSPPFDSAGITALAGAQMLFEILCLSAEALVKRRKATASLPNAPTR